MNEMTESSKRADDDKLPAVQKLADRAIGAARYAIIASRWNEDVVNALLRGAREALTEEGVTGEFIDVFHVPGAWDIPALAERLARDGRHAAIIALGCVVRGKTRHYEIVADGCARGLMNVATGHAMPVMNGVLAVDKLKHAQSRAGGKDGNKGAEVGQAALEMVRVWSRR